jgi:DNA-binding CsgD family transcriptional regulator
MVGRISSATERALKRVAKGQSIRSSALAEGISPSTLFRALKRLKKGRP